MQNTHKTLKLLTLGLLTIALAFSTSTGYAFSDDISQALEDNIEIRTQLENQSLLWNEGMASDPKIVLSQTDLTNHTDVKKS